ncbi:MAG: beta-galactosidase, partial [Asticcacaulis sp.]|nr:beta-galactosidase [Asticcacaulis sp.]
MNRRELFKGASALGLAASTPGFVSRAVAETMAPSVAAPVASLRQVLLLNKGWRFFAGDIPFPPIMGHDDTYNAAKAGAARAAASPKFDDGTWQPVTLPHDFVSFQPIEESGNVDQGYRHRGVAWYRNMLRFEPQDDGKHIELQLDGVATFATVWFNGTLVDRNWSGYNSIYIDLTPYATYGDQLNSLVVRVDVFAHPVKDEHGWHVPVEVTIYNSGDKTETVRVHTDIGDEKWGDEKSPAGARLGVTKEVSVAPLSSTVVTYDLPFANPQLWSVDTPHLYQVTTSLMSTTDKVLDQVTTNAGFRTQRFDAQKGFFLNDQPVKIKGVCLHQDHAGVGTAVPDGVLDFRLRRMKSLGCNAIRFSHNAQSKELMDACDRHGFLVMAENRNFNASPDYLAQLEWLVRRDRNHPSVFLWSVFNEEPMQGTEAGYQMVRRMSSVVKSLDTSRPVTAAMSGGLLTPLNVSHAVDVVGINYQQRLYDPFHAAHPEKPMFSSEDSSALMTRGAFVTDKKAQVLASYDDEFAPWGETHRDAWKQIDTRDFVAGTFVWTGFDYHGEPKPFSWPSNSSYFGIMDLC